uniref:oligosaccharide repeat unit polymerase n=1 Tax=Scandinavium goeteborgense TaxID=1851514 RepID=UPI0013598CCC|nr:oligosaccharide repeat unit polymerase [Scandinavium goeteborgense]
MTLSPTGIFILLYFISNITLGAYYGYTGVLGGDFTGVKIKNDELYFAVYLIELGLMSLFLILLRFIYRTRKVQANDDNYGWLNKYVFFIQLSFLIYSYTTGVGRLSQDYYGTNVDNPLKYFFTFFNADYFFLVSLCINSRINKTNVGLYLISNIYRGWFAGALLNIIFICAVKIFPNARMRFRTIFIIFAGFILLAPSIYYIKYVSRGADSIGLEAVSQYYQKDLYSQVINSAFSRFQHISETYSIVQDIDVLATGYESGQFVPFFFENPAKRQLAKMFNYENDLTITQYSAESILQKIPGNIQIGLLPWLLISPYLTVIFLLYLVVTFIVLVSYLKKLTSQNVWPYCVWITMLLAMHGWFTSYFMFLWSLFLVATLKYVRKLMLNKPLEIK